MFLLCSPACVLCSGVPFELKARDYAAETLTAALGVTRTSRDVLAVSAMEAIGVAGEWVEGWVGDRPV
jgi:hypothetical protein